METEKWQLMNASDWMESLEQAVTDDIYHDIITHFGVDNIAELNEDQISEVDDYLLEIKDNHHLSFFYTCIRNVIKMWEASQWV